ncbi:Diphthamide synthase DPH6 [Methanonatronarchaeum thermophilum]|uniref:Diphthamide synthase DPH6 n=1 Tax=Methanonatronarchaeum thermophilum TaxID=1927129 RepID=A0A1Y3GCY5_9EURY|nr:diphthine--ammonia ligase [Methanonatronarchaeum thermophilum]OUJ19259.1 Diphthamide synthase DPH6 [Methanonatronarchaeum thermophilum]
MTCFCSWSGGKDSCLSLDRAINTHDLEIDYLINMINKDRKIGHGTPPKYIQKQADALDLQLIQKKVTWNTYEENYSKILEKLNPDIGVFGDMDIEEHKNWVTNFCKKHKVTPVLPLWNENPTKLYKEFTNQYTAIIIKIDPQKIDEKWLGKPLNQQFLQYLKNNKIHPMGEGGEYHTYVTNGPLFKNKIKYKLGKKHKDKKTGTISINLK